MKLIEIVADRSSADTVVSLAKQKDVQSLRLGTPDSAGVQTMQILAADDKVQAILDGLQSVLDAHPKARVYVVPVEISLPEPPEAESKKEQEATTAREALYDTASKNVMLNWNLVVLAVLSTAVAAIGLVENNVAALIGAMVIAPLLWPNLAFGLGTALGDGELMKRSSVSLAVGLAIAVGLAALMGALWPFQISSPVIQARTQVDWSSAALALSAGAVAALSLTTRLPSILVGVMVAVALLPPVVTLGLLLGRRRWDPAGGAALLLAVNIVCVNLACNLVFLSKGIAPRSWWEQRRARRATINYILVWVVTLALLVLASYARRVINRTG